MAKNIKQIQGAVERVNAVPNDTVFSPSEIVALVNNKSVIATVFQLYRLINRGELLAVNLGTKDDPRYHVKGRDIKKFFKARFGQI